jgi:1,4-alpha-glucan branching enzyme
MPVHVQPSARRFTLRAAEAGTYVVTVAVPSARTVEISGDFNEWRPLSLRETRPDVWEATVPIAPGTYHVNMRVNGASWVAPPGLSETSDDFNGTVGLLVVP